MTALSIPNGNSSRRGSRRAERVGYRHALANRHFNSVDHQSGKIADRPRHVVGSSHVRSFVAQQHATGQQEPCPQIQSIRCTR